MLPQIFCWFLSQARHLCLSPSDGNVNDQLLASFWNNQKGCPSPNSAQKIFPINFHNRFFSIVIFCCGPTSHCHWEFHDGQLLFLLSLAGALLWEVLLGGPLKICLEHLLVCLLDFGKLEIEFRLHVFFHYFCWTSTWHDVNFLDLLHSQSQIDIFGIFPTHI